MMAITAKTLSGMDGRCAASTLELNLGKMVIVEITGDGSTLYLKGTLASSSSEHVTIKVAEGTVQLPYRSPNYSLIIRRITLSSKFPHGEDVLYDLSRTIPPNYRAGSLGSSLTADYIRLLKR